MWYLKDVRGNIAAIKRVFFLVIISAVSVVLLLAQEIPREHH
jgi:hypothetical protein